jgi:hypothetical protein
MIDAFHDLFYLPGVIGIDVADPDDGGQGRGGNLFSPGLRVSIGKRAFF